MAGQESPSPGLAVRHPNKVLQDKGNVSERIVVLVTKFSDRLL